MYLFGAKADPIFKVFSILLIILYFVQLIYNYVKWKHQKSSALIPVSLAESDRETGILVLLQKSSCLAPQPPEVGTVRYLLYDQVIRNLTSNRSKGQNILDVTHRYAAPTLEKHEGTLDHVTKLIKIFIIFALFNSVFLGGITFPISLCRATRVRHAWKERTSDQFMGAI